MIAFPYYNYSNITTIFIFGFLVFIASIFLSVFSPFGIGFIIASLVRWKSESRGSKNLAKVFQIVLTIFTFLFGFLAAILFSFFVSGFSYYNFGNLISLLLALIGVGLVGAVEIGIILWQNNL